MRWDEGEIRAVAAQGHAFIDRATARELGGSDSRIQSRLANRVWTRVHPGVYHLDVTMPTWKARLQAAVLAAGPAALASHRSAMQLWKLDGVTSRILEITVPYTKLPVPAGVVVHRTRRVLPASKVDGIAVTTVERTLLDLAALCPERVLEKALSSALHQRLTTVERMAQTLVEEGGRGVRGTRKLRRTLEYVTYDATGSPAEVDLARLMRTSSIPPPKCQLEIALPDGSRAYPDFAWPLRRKCIEVDGFESHGSPVAMERDLARQNLLLESGWEIRRFSARTIRNEPAAVLRVIQRFLDA